MAISHTACKASQRHFKLWMAHETQTSWPYLLRFMAGSHAYSRTFLWLSCYNSRTERL